MEIKFRKYRTPAPFGLVIGIILLVFGMYTLLANLNYMNINEQFISNAEAVSASAISSSDYGSLSYRESLVEYTYNGKKYENVVIENYGQLIIPGNEVKLYVNPEHPEQCEIRYLATDGIGKTYNIFTIMGLVSGLFMILVSISRIRNGETWD